MRKFFAIVVCKLLRFVGKLVGKGSSLPGKYALKICPDILKRVTLPPCVIAVTGSNGKTSTVEMIAAILRREGRSLVYNEEGSNQIEGVVTLVLCNATLGGKMRADVLLIESDERYAAHSFQYFHPTHFVITNLYRDQLTRNGHPEWVAAALLPAIHPQTTLFLNADDPLVSCFGRGHEKVKWFGLDPCDFDTKEPVGMYRDGALCPVCKAPMVYDAYHYNHIGSYRCTACNHHRHGTDYTATRVDLDKGEVELDGALTIPLAFSSIYHVYNLLAAYAVCSSVGVSKEVIAQVISNYMLKNGRVVRFTLGAHPGTLLVSKHENSVAYDSNLRYVRNTKKPCTVVLIVDAISRKYFTGETSWLWDINFDQLNCDVVRHVLLCGRYANDLAVRFSYTELPPEKLAVCADIHKVALGLQSRGDEDIYVITCFSDKDKLLSEVRVIKEDA